MNASAPTAKPAKRAVPPTRNSCTQRGGGKTARHQNATEANPASTAATRTGAETAVSGRATSKNQMSRHAAKEKAVTWATSQGHQREDPRLASRRNSLARR